VKSSCFLPQKFIAATLVMLMIAVFSFAQQQDFRGKLAVGLQKKISTMSLFFHRTFMNSGILFSMVELILRSTEIFLLAATTDLH
jgi:hypothetical protein